MNFGIFLEQELSNRNLSKSSFSKKLSISRQTLTTNIQQWKNGREPNVKTIKKYLEILNIDISLFFNKM